MYPDPNAPLWEIPIPVVPGQAGGGSFQKEKNYIAQKEFAYRMCKVTDQRDAQIISLL